MASRISRSFLSATLIALLCTVPGIAAPLPTSGLRGHFKGDVGVITSGSDVTQWNDQAPLSGSNNATALLVAKPTTATVPIGYHASFPVVTFGAGTPLSFTLPSANLFSGVTVLVVSSRNAPNNQYETVLSTGGVGGGSSAGVRWAFSMGTDSAAGYGWAGPTSTINLGNGSSISNDTWHTLTWSYDQTAWSVRKEYPTSLAVSSPADTSFFTGTWNGVIGTEGISSPGTYHFSGQIAELLIYDHKLTPTEYQAALAYLDERFFIAPVPEPSTAVLLGIGLVGMIRRKRRID